MNPNFSPAPTRLTTLTLLLALLLASALHLIAAQRPHQPNFIFLLIDDMGYGDLSCYGGEPGETPHIDSMAREGIRFSQFYVGAPICSPSRTAFTTGQFPVRWRMNSYLASRRENKGRGIPNWLDPKAPTLARILRQAGYTTGHFGKWHMGGQRDVGEAPLITEYGFDESLTQFEGLGDRILPLLNAFDGEPPRKHSLGSETLGRGNIQWMDRSKVTSGFVDRALEFIRKAEQEGKPFYVNLWPDDVHSPFFPPKALRSDGTKRQLYLGVTKAMDEQFAPLFTYLRASPVLRTNTILIISSDNGPEPGAGSAGPFRGHKGNLYEGGIREPFIVWAPGFLGPSARGTLNDRTVLSAVDLLPSIARLAGVSLSPGIKPDGEDLSTSFLGKGAQTRSKPLFWLRPPDRPGNGERWPDLALRDADWKLLLMQDGTGAQLYDLAHDPGETNNLASSNPKTVQRMSRPLLDWSKSLPVNKLAPEQKRAQAKRSKPLVSFMK